MELSPATAGVYVRAGFERALAVVDRLGDDLVNQPPVGPATNSVAGLVVHCCGVAEFWLGHVALGRPDHRRRDEEFTTVASVAELHERVGHTIAQVLADIDALEAGRGVDEGGVRAFLPGADTTDASVVLHLYDELFQHVGHMELAADVLLAR